MRTLVQKTVVGTMIAGASLAVEDIPLPKEPNMTKDEDRDRASLDRVLSVIDAIPSDRRDDETETISVGALRLLRAAFAADRLEALARPVVGVEGRQELLAKLEWFLNAYKLEEERLRLIPTLTTALACAETIADTNAKLGELLPDMIAALAASPSPVVGDREAIGRVELCHLIYERYPDIEPSQFSGPYRRTFDEARSRGLPNAKTAMEIADAILSLSTPVVGGGWSPIDQAPRNGESMLGWSSGCGYDVVRINSDGKCYAGAFNADWVKFVRPLPEPPAPDPHTMGRAGMAQDAE